MQEMASGIATEMAEREEVLERMDSERNQIQKCNEKNLDGDTRRLHANSIG